MLYYQLRNGNIASEYEVHKAFEICTGEAYHYDSKAYSKWLYSMLGKSIIKAMNETEINIEQFIKANNIVAAVRLYRNQHNCTLREAKDAVDAMRFPVTETNDKRLYVYYKVDGNRIIVENFSNFNSLSAWCEENCAKNGNGYYLDNNLIMCGYDAAKEE